MRWDFGNYIQDGSHRTKMATTHWAPCLHSYRVTTTHAYIWYTILYQTIDRDRQRDRKKDRQTDRPTDRHADRQPVFTVMPISHPHRYY